MFEMRRPHLRVLRRQIPLRLRLEIQRLPPRPRPSLLHLRRERLGVPAATRVLPDASTHLGVLRGEIVPICAFSEAFSPRSPRAHPPSPGSTPSRPYPRYAPLRCDASPRGSQPPTERRRRLSLRAALRHLAPRGFHRRGERLLILAADGTGETALILAFKVEGGVVESLGEGGERGVEDG